MRIRKSLSGLGPDRRYEKFRADRRDKEAGRQFGGAGQGAGRQLEDPAQKKRPLSDDSGGAVVASLRPERLSSAGGRKRERWKNSGKKEPSRLFRRDRSEKNILRRRKPLAIYASVYYNSTIKKSQGGRFMIKTIAKPAERKVTGCGECRSTCQSACKTSCTVGNQSCERITREEKIERK